MESQRNKQRHMTRIALIKAFDNLYTVIHNFNDCALTSENFDLTKQAAENIIQLSRTLENLYSNIFLEEEPQ